MITAEQQKALYILEDALYSETKLTDGMDRVREEFERLNSEEYILEKIKELQENGTLWFKAQIKKQTT